MQGSHVTQFDSDKDLMKTLMNNFGSILVFIFYADWNAESKQFLEGFNNSIPIFGQFDNVKYYSLCAQKCPQTLKKFEVQKTPTVIFTQTDKKILQKIQSNDIGVVFDSLEKLSPEYKAQFQKDIALWHPKVKSLIESCPFIVFIKGTPQNPKCGFTRTILQIFKNHQIQYTYYDIIQDEQMRYWVRHYSNWSTYPSVFINGKSIGGLDKIKQLIQKKQFDKIVPESCKQITGEQRYNKYITQHQNVVFIDGFTFENKQSDKAIEDARKQYGDNVALYNVGIDKNIKQYIVQKLIKKLPFVVHAKNIVQ